MPRLDRVTSYVISEVRIVDQDLAQRYMTLAAASIERHGGTYLVRGATPSVPEGEWDADRRVVVVSFPSVEARDDWYASPDYAEALELRAEALDRRLLFVCGVDEQD
jgi:uncharacterized protein (DUF1330 family)